MEMVFITLFTLLISVTTFTNLNSQELRMSISGIYNGETKETIEDQEDMNSKYLMYTVDKTCLRIESLIFKGNYKNVTLKIHCGSSGKLLSKTKLNIKGMYTFPWTSSKYGNCNPDDEIIYSISVEDSKGELIYRCNITGGDCEV
jgi:hypothetical protein